MEEPAVKKRSVWSRLLGGANLVVYTAAGIAIIVFLNYVANRYSHRWDLTPNQKYTLSPESAKLLKGLDRDVAIYVFDQDRGHAGHDLTDLYSKASHRVAVHYVDPDRDPSLAKQFGVRSFGTTILAAGDRHFEAQAATEEGITNALIRVLKGQKTVYFVQGHGERDLENSDRSGYDRFKKQLGNENYLVKTLVLLQKLEIPGDCSLLIVAGPRNDYEQPEVDVIKKYVQGGGRILFMFDPLVDPRGKNPENLAKLLGEWNANLRNDLVIDVNPIARVFGTRPEMPLILKYGSSPIVQPLAQTATLFPLTRSFQIGKDSKPGVTDDSLCETSSESYAVADFTPKMREVNFRPGKDTKGPLSVAVAGTVAGEGEKRTEGRFVALGTSSLAANVYLGFQGNRDLIMNMVNWLSQQEDLISIRPKPPEQQHLTMTARQMDTLLYGGVIGLPLLIILLGVGVWWRRR